MNRRTFLKDAGLLAGGLAASSMLPDMAMGAPNPQSRRTERQFNADASRPNILVIMVDQLRYPQGAFNQTLMDDTAPNLAALRAESVSFGHHCGAATACSPSRSTLLTGLYTHQSAMFLTNVQGLAGQGATPSLNPGFPTWGSILSSDDFGYNTYWWGKWHLAIDDSETPDWAERYGFDDGGLPCPSPNGGPAQGLGLDPLTSQTVFKNWLDAMSALGPWCTTVSLVNPHDVQWFPKYSTEEPGENDPPVIPEFHAGLPANFEHWPEALVVQGKPKLQQAWVILSDAVFGVMPTNPPAPGYPELWFQLLDLYYQVTGYVDKQIGAVLSSLAASVAANNTIIVFTSDHGEYAGAHGMHGKGFAAYEESIRVPLFVKDPTGEFIPAGQVGTEREQLTSHVDITPLLMTLASGNDNWRSDPKYGHLANRADLVAMLNNPSAQGRSYILHTCDEDIPEEAPKVGIPYKDVLARNALSEPTPTHLIAYRTDDTKLGVYSFFVPNTIEIQASEQQSELYDYTKDGVAEVINHAPSGSAPDLTLYNQLYNALFDPTNGAIVKELRAPLPAYLQPVQDAAMAEYLAYEASLKDTVFQYMPSVAK